MSEITANIEDGKIKIKSPYNKDFISRAKSIQGKWDSPFWIFPEDNISELKDLLIDIYGNCGNLDDTPIPTVTIDVDLDKYEYNTEIKIGSLVAVSRRTRDSNVTYADNVILVKGSFTETGGSRNNPHVAHNPGTVIRIKNLPVAIFEKVKDLNGVTLVTDKIDIESLVKERDELLERIRTLDELIKTAERTDSID